jgi:indolepyruvate ferredoxin oxidoreductase beta subunit
MRPFGVFITGVGGQGILLASEILSDVAMSAGKDVKKSEVHGMAQRGGNVVSAVRFGDIVHSPVISEAEADVILSFEPMEALRNIRFADPGGTIITNTRRISPASVSSGQAVYPEDINERIKAVYPKAEFLDAQAIAEEAGSVKAVNVVLWVPFQIILISPLKTGILQISRWVPAKSLEINMKAFEMGRNACSCNK